MNRIIIIILFIASTINAIGLKIGMNYSNQIITSKNNASFKNTFYNGPILGFSWRPITINKSNQFMWELYYLERGMIERGINTDEDGSYPKEWWFVNRFSYMSINILYRFNYHLQHNNSTYFVIGPRYDKLLSKHTESGNPWKGYLYNISEENEFGIDIGFGYKAHNLTVEYRYSYNYTNSTTNDNFTVNNYSHSLIVGLEFPRYYDR